MRFWLLIDGLQRMPVAAQQGVELTAYPVAQLRLWRNASICRAFEPAVEPAASEPLVRWAAPGE